MIEFRRIDFEKHKELCVEFRADSFRASFPDNWRDYWNESKYRAWIEGHAKRFPDGVLHIWKQKQIIGQLEFSYTNEKGHVNLYYLSSAYREKGYGVIAHDHIVSVMRQNGCKTASLRASTINTRAISFYKNLGWEDLGLDPDHNNAHNFTINLSRKRGQTRYRCRLSTPPLFVENPRLAVPASILMASGCTSCSGNNSSLAPVSYSALPPFASW